MCVPGAGDGGGGLWGESRVTAVRGVTYSEKETTALEIGDQEASAAPEGGSYRSLRCSTPSGAEAGKAAGRATFLGRGREGEKWS